MKEEGRFRTWYWWLILGAAVVVALGIGLMVGTVREAPREALAPVEGFTLADVAPALPEEAAALPYTSDILGLDELLASVVAPGPVIVDLGDLGIISLSDLEAFLAEGSERAAAFPGYNALDGLDVEVPEIRDISDGFTIETVEEPAIPYGVEDYY